VFQDILAQIDMEISRLQQAKSLLLGVDGSPKRGPGRPSKAWAAAVAAKSQRRKMSAEARERIRQGQIKRWATAKQAAKKTAKKSA
jgi:hypothetical protein